MVAACPNVRFELGVKQACLLPAFKVLGLQLEKVAIRKPAGGGQQEELGRVWKSCSMHGPQCKVADIRAFFRISEAIYEKSAYSPRPSTFNGGYPSVRSQDRFTGRI